MRQYTRLAGMEIARDINKTRDFCIVEVEKLEPEPVLSVLLNSQKKGVQRPTVAIDSAESKGQQLPSRSRIERPTVGIERPKVAIDSPSELCSF